jgi:ribose transport system ATP-binding protein
MALAAASSADSRRPIFSMRGGAKRFAGVTVIEGVDIDIFENEIIGIAGENGAGKSTTLKMIAGIHKPSEGQMTLFGRPYAPDRYTDAVRAGVSMVFQEQALVPNLRVYENFFLSHESKFSRGGLVDSGRMIELAERHLRDLGLGHIDPRRVTGSYPFHDRQMIEIAKAFVLADFFEVAHPIVLLDEPTAAIGDKEVALLFDSIRRFRDRASFVLITHRLAEYVTLCDRLYVMKDGHLVSEMVKGDFEQPRIHQAMVGRARDEEYYKEGAQQRIGSETPVVLSAEGISGGNVRGVSFSLHRGEVLGLGGLVGCGKEDVARAVVGYEPFPTSGRVTVKGKPLPLRRRGKASIASDVGFVPKERKTEGIIPYLSVAANTSLASLKAVTWLPGFISSAKETRVARDYIGKLRVRTTGPRQLCQYLSGGNQQKVVMAKWLARGVDILVLDNPTRGVDVGAKEEIYALMRELAATGVAILLVTDDLLELIGLSNRILIMRDGVVVTERPAPPEAKPTEQELVGFMV